MNEFIKSGLKKVGSTAGKAGRALADGFLEEMGSTARKLSKDKRVTEENREKYSQTADTISLLREHLHQDSEAKLSKRKLPKNEQQTANINSSEIQSTLTNPTILYFNEAKETIQLNNSTSDNDIGELTLDEWDKKWVSCGKLADARVDEFTAAGLLRLEVDDKTVLIIRAIDIRQGGISKKVKSIKCGSLRATPLAKKILENYDLITLKILQIGVDINSINIARNLEKQMISKYKPTWI